MTKEEILRYFEQNKGEIVSGEELASTLGVTRAAIWKVINVLRVEGYDIESIRKKGYRLNMNSDILSLIKLSERLKDLEGVDIRLYKTIDSTNKQAKLFAIKENKEWIVVASEQQKEGKGYSQKAFTSPEGKGIYVSIVLKPPKTVKDVKIFSKLASESVKKAIKQIAGIKMAAREPNDLCYEGQKLCGILTEACIEAETGCISFVVIGIGINVYGTKVDFEGAQGDIETSLSEVTGRYCNRSHIIAEIINALREGYEKL